LFQINKGAPRKAYSPAKQAGDIWMSNSDDWKKRVRLNKLLGMWAAQELGLKGRDSEAYSDALALGTLDPEDSDVLSRIRKDFDAAGVVQSDEQILCVMNKLALQVESQMTVARGDAGDALTVVLARKLKPE
jgi:hypothetical protein